MSVSPVLNSAPGRAASMAASATPQARATSGTAKNAASAQAYASASATSGSGINDVTDNFMTLLIAQMQNQDPTNPLSNNELTSQLAQLNTASGIQDLNKTLNGVAGLVSGVQQMSAVEWIGRHVFIEGETTVSTLEEGNKEFAFAVNNDVDKVTVTLTDSEGNAYTAQIKEAKAGVNKYTLDDLTDFQPSDPREMEDKSFKVSYSASNEDGSVPDITSLKKAKVESVVFSTAGAILQLGLDGTTQIDYVYGIE